MVDYISADELSDDLQKIKEDIAELKTKYANSDKLFRWLNDRMIIVEDKVNESLGLWGD